MICKVKVISTGSKGNAVLLNDEILIDCGVPFRELEPYCKGLRLVLLTHVHGDHFNPETIKRLHFLRPALRWCVPPWLMEPMGRIGVDRRVTDEAMQRHDLFYLYPKALPLMYGTTQFRMMFRTVRGIFSLQTARNRTGSTTSSMRRTARR